MRGFACMFLTASLCLAGSGCAIFGKKSESSTGSSGGFFSKLGKQPAKFPTAPDPMFPGTPNPSAPVATPTSATADQALLAGRVVDAFNRSPTNTYIRWVCLEEGKETKDAPIDVAVNPEGYFTIQGLKPGAQYKLIARSKQGEKLLAGITYTQAPNVRVVIQVKEDFASSATPPADDKKTTGVAPPSESAWGPTSPAPTAALAPGSPPQIGAVRPAGEPNLPAVSVPAPAAAARATPTPNWSPGATATEPTSGPSWPPTLDIKPKAPVGLPPNPPQPPPLKDAKVSQQPTRVPSCVVAGNQLVNLALTDTAGQKWEFQKDRRGRLVLLDFWGTTCLPCRQTMPELQRLHTQYGSGLEVIGVALEDGALEQQAYAVKQVCNRLNVTYRQLLGEPKKSDLRRQFSVEMIPTLILVNDSGVILWRHTGRPDAATIQELERLIQQRFGSQVF